ncbi:MAG: radical SAM protein [Candidatus Sericytochromatia bacterium]|nr:radical SAM protein [Candidatus Tanganyikabacteria bacterium]
MKLLDCVVKQSGQDFWLYHAAGSYRARMDAAAVEALRGLLAKAGEDPLSEDEALIYRRLHARGLISPRAPGSGEDGLRILEKSPLRTLDIEVSSRCNLSCGHCFAALEDKQMNRETIDRLLAGCEDLEPVNFVLNGGEPLLNPEWRYAVSRARKRGMRVVVMTNGTTITGDVASFMAAERVAKVAISLDGFQERHDALRGPRAFARTVAGIRRLVAAELAVFVTTMLSDDTLARQEEFEKFCLENLGVAAIRYSGIVPIGRGGEAPPAFQVPDGALQAIHGAGLLAANDAEPPPAADGEAAWSCDAGTEQLFVGADGLVYACHYFQNLREPLGDLRATPLSEIYRAAQVGEIKARTSWRDLPACQGCPALAACKGGCRARARLMAGSLSARDPYSCRTYGR